MTRLRTATLTAAVALALASCGGDDTSSTSGTDPDVTGALMAPDGTKKGTVSLSFDSDSTTITVKGTGLTPGLHGFHVHKTGTCEPDSADPAKPDVKGAFLSAAGHLAASGQTHGSHDGDLPSLLVRGDGTAELTVTTDRVTKDSVLDEDGSAVMVHEKPDNFGNVPDRYTAAVDETTQKTGDAGPRVACAALKG